MYLYKVIFAILTMFLLIACDEGYYYEYKINMCVNNGGVKEVRVKARYIEYLCKDGYIFTQYPLEYKFISGP